MTNTEKAVAKQFRSLNYHIKHLQRILRDSLPEGSSLNAFVKLRVGPSMPGQKDVGSEISVLDVKE